MALLGNLQNGRFGVLKVNPMVQQPKILEHKISGERGPRTLGQQGFGFGV